MNEFWGKSEFWFVQKYFYSGSLMVLELQSWRISHFLIWFQLSSKWLCHLASQPINYSKDKEPNEFTADYKIEYIQRYPFFNSSWRICVLPWDPNPYPGILEKIQNAGPSPSAFRGKKSRAQRCIICICFCALDFFPESVLGDGPKNSRIRVNCLKSTVHCVKHAY